MQPVQTGQYYVTGDKPFDFLRVIPAILANPFIPDEKTSDLAMFLFDSVKFTASC
jgi:hypothetical protein